MSLISDKIRELKVEMDSKYGEGNWSIRKVSHLRKDSNTPSLTITQELKLLDIKPDDYVVVVKDSNKIIIISI